MDGMSPYQEIGKNTSRTRITLLCTAPLCITSECNCYGSPDLDIEEPIYSDASHIQKGLDYFDVTAW